MSRSAAAKKRVKMDSTERRDMIVRDVRRVFAEKGFKGATTRELARAAGVSEALLFKHFPTKEALYEAMLLKCKAQDSACEWERIAVMKPSTDTLVHCVRHLVTYLATKDKTDPEGLITDRLLLRSLCEDGTFARVLFGRINEHIIAQMDASIRAATRAGDIPGGKGSRARAWFVLHVGIMILFSRLPSKPALEYGATVPQLIEEAVAFCLRGLGLRESAITGGKRSR
ncbi:MAG: TetR/AcrR family transcriptional regulator [Candidatus Sumerlaeaceae bacterium]|nr:TetR/AcrR family transcriptional regulator [Candidatus Sumerlaeaceae bacterium]